MRDLLLDLRQYSDSFNVMMNTLDGHDLLNSDYVHVEVLHKKFKGLDEKDEKV